MHRDKITAFPDGISIVEYNAGLERLFIANSEGVLKIFNIKEPDLEPNSIDINENVTSLSFYANKILVTNTEGNLEIIDAASNSSEGVLYRSELPLRDASFTNEGKRVVCGGDDNKLAWVDLSNSNKTQTMVLPDQFLNVSYNATGELIAVSLSNGTVQIYNVLNEEPSEVKTIKGVIPVKIHSSLGKIDYLDEHKDELLATKSQWTSDGETLLLPTETSIVSYLRSNWDEKVKEFRNDLSNSIVDFSLSPNDKFLAIAYKDMSLKVFEFKSGDEFRSYNLEDLGDQYPTNLAWSTNPEDSDLILNIGTTDGTVLTIDDSFLKKTNSSLEKLFLDEAEESDEEDFNLTSINGDKKRVKLHEEDSMIIDDDEEELDGEQDEDDTIGDVYDHNRLGRKSRKRPKLSDKSRYNGIMRNASAFLVPYSPGSTPWTEPNGNIHSTNRRYLFMNSVGYVWCVRSTSDAEILNQQSITISFFDRSINKDYHFIDHYNFDLCSMNEVGVLFACSGFESTTKEKAGHIFYRKHDSVQDSWERTVPLLKSEFLTSISVTSTASNDSIVIVGSNLGYLRIFNLYGLCINLIKTLPILTMISASNGMLFLINKSPNDGFLYSIIDVNNNYTFIQHYVPLPLLEPNEGSGVPLIKGVFFNEYNDPCLVPGFDDTLLILSGWRESNNARWIPILNCNNAIKIQSSLDSRHNWKYWPLGLYKQQLSCLLLKSGSHYPGFPLPLPIEIEVSMPTSVKEDTGLSNEKNTNSASSSIDEDPEESFLRSSTFGKILSDSLNDKENEEYNDEILERLEEFSILFDKSLLKLFASACQNSHLGKAMSVAKLIKSDKALVAASRIAERLDLVNIASRIGSLREELVDLSDADS